MNPKSDRMQSEQPRPVLSPAPRKRFRVQKLEDRIAPAGCRLGHYNPHSKVVGSRAFC